MHCCPSNYPVCDGTTGQCMQVWGRRRAFVPRRECTTECLIARARAGAAAAAGGLPVWARALGGRPDVHEGAREGGELVQQQRSERSLRARRRTHTLVPPRGLQIPSTCVTTVVHARARAACRAVGPLRRLCGDPTPRRVHAPGVHDLLSSRTAPSCRHSAMRGGIPPIDAIAALLAALYALRKYTTKTASARGIGDPTRVHEMRDAATLSLTSAPPGIKPGCGCL